MDLGAKLTNYFNKWFIHATHEIHVTKFWLIRLVDDHECVRVTTSQNWNEKKKSLFGYLSMEFGCKIDKLFQQVILFMQLVLQ
jgi:hypothetical protein